MDLIRRFTRKLRLSAITFGLPEAVILSLLGIAVVLLAAYHYTRFGGPPANG